MSMSPTIDEVRHAYELLGIPYASYSPAIKQAYRKMAKRWHPDLFAQGSREQQQASEMMQRINEAYEEIKDAPLRYFVPRPADRTAHNPQPTPWPRPTNPSPANTTKPDRIEFWTRFVFGAFVGLLLSSRMWIIFDRSPILAGLFSIVLILAAGYAAGRQGDRYWYSLFGARWSGGSSFRWPW
jgi:DnaJ domain